jgi:large subunit ribosomal protein L5
MTGRDMTKDKEQKAQGQKAEKAPDKAAGGAGSNKGAEAKKAAKAAGDSGTAGKAAGEAKGGESKAPGKAAAEQKGGHLTAGGAMPARLQTHYRDHVVPELKKQFSYSTSMQVPRFVKITLNMGVGEAVADKKNIDAAIADLTRIAGQKPVVTRARKAIANFKIRQGLPIGCMVTLRGSRMYEFLDRLITIAFPRMRDFRGVSTRAFDGRGNYSIGFKEQIIFPEIEYDKIDKVRGLNVSITTTAKSDEEAKALLAAFRFPFRN